MKTKIENYLKMFEIKEVERNNQATLREKKSIVVFADDASEDLKDSVRKAHGDRLPSDWVFEKYYYILDAMLQYIADDTQTIIDDAKYEIVDGLVDVYTGDLTEWLNSNNNNVYYLTEAIDQYEIKDGFRALATAQSLAIDEIYGEVMNLLNK